MKVKNNLPEDTESLYGLWQIYEEHKLNKKMLHIKEKIFDFIKSKQPNILEVVSFSLKDEDDENGFIGEHYIVMCLLSSYNSDGRYDKTCLVNISEFKKWLEGQKSIIWLD